MSFYVFITRDLTSFGAQVVYVKYQDPSSVLVAQHLTNTVFIDKALIVVPIGDGKFMKNVVTVIGGRFQQF